jgi:hypothetical protein
MLAATGISVQTVAQLVKKKTPESGAARGARGKLQLGEWRGASNAWCVVVLGQAHWDRLLRLDRGTGVRPVNADRARTPPVLSAS